MSVMRDVSIQCDAKPDGVSCLTWDGHGQTAAEVRRELQPLGWRRKTIYRWGGTEKIDLCPEHAREVSE